MTISETVPPGVSGPVTFPPPPPPPSNGTNTDRDRNDRGWGRHNYSDDASVLGTNQITASTPGDSNNNPATSPAVSVTVVKTAPTVSVTSSLNPSVINQAVTFTAIAPAGRNGNDNVS